MASIAEIPFENVMDSADTEESASGHVEKNTPGVRARGLAGKSCKRRGGPVGAFIVFPGDNERTIGIALDRNGVGFSVRILIQNSIVGAGDLFNIELY